ncbi:MAG: class I SAM-dependent methyltransferase [Eubacteriales bacterium]
MDKTKVAYESSQNIYDDILTQNSFWGKLYMKLFWSGVDDNEIAKKMLERIPDDFQGNLLDVPVGTAVFTEKKWKQLNSAHITCLDYSEDMLEQAKKKIGSCENITLLQGDVGALPLEENSQDIVLSMNGFHAFPDKNKAYEEIFRVLKPSGQFISCFYIKGESKITDWLVASILSKKGWFTPPFQTFQQVKDSLEGKYQDISIEKEGSMVYFSVQKGIFHESN